MPPATVPPTCEAGPGGIVGAPPNPGPAPINPGEVNPIEPLRCEEESGELGGRDPGVGSDPFA